MTRILHIKLIDFPIAVERHLNPALKRQAVVVAMPLAEEAQVFAISPEARKYGINLASRVGDAKRKPKVVVVPGDRKRYGDVSNRVLQSLQLHLPGKATDTLGEFILYPDFKQADRIDDIIQKILNPKFAFRGGMATLSIVASAAADKASRNQIQMVNPYQERTFWNEVSIRWLPWVGPRRKKEMLEMGIRTVGDFLSLDPVVAKSIWGNDIWKCRQWLTSDQLLDDTKRAVSRRFERVFPQTTYRQYQVLEGLDSACQEAASWLRQGIFTPTAVSMAIRYPDGSGARGHSKLSASVDDRNFFHRARVLLKQLWVRRVRLERMEIVFDAIPGENRQMSLFENRGRQRVGQLGQAMDRVRNRYGYRVINYGSSVALQV
jgi:nucleotidyltransferase/DNA polymerase involved in DNA repair